MSSPAYMTLCPGCAEKYGKLRLMLETGQPFVGYCSSPMCRTKTAVLQYEVGPRYDELERRRRRAIAEDKKKAPRAGGERGRAERRAGHGQAV